MRSILKGMKYIPLLYLLFTAGFTMPGYSQSTFQVSEYFIQPKYSALRFKRILNIYEWKYTLNYQKYVGQKLFFRLNEDYSSTLQRRDTGDLWKDNQNLRLNLRYPLARRLSIEPSFYSRILSDPLAGFSNDIVYNSGTLNFNYTPSANIQISPKVSGKWQTQLKQSDQGVGFGLDADINDWNVSGYRNDLTFAGDQDIFPRRKNQNIRLRYRIHRQFYSATADTFTIIFDKLRRDTFDQLNDTLIVRNLIQSSRGFENKLSYALSSSSTLFVTNSIISTTLRVNNIREENRDELQKDDHGFESNHSVLLKLTQPTWTGDVSYIYKLRKRDDKRPRSQSPDPFGRYPTVGFDDEDVFVQINSHAGIKLGKSDSLNAFASVSKFRYDTTDTTNQNDHDQVRWQVSLSYLHKFSHDLHLLWRASTFLNHFVFISSQFSNGNNWERTFQLSPQIQYRPSPALSVTQGFTVRAKYLTFDFDDQETSSRNTVNRQFIIYNNSRINFTPGSWIDLSFNLELAEQGKIFFSEWKQNLSLSWQNREARLMFKQLFTNNLLFSLGSHYFKQTRWDHRVNAEGGSVKTIQAKHTNWGPILEVVYLARDSFEVLLSGNIKFVNSSRRNTENIKQFDVKLNWFF